MKSFNEWLSIRDENFNEWWPFSQKNIVDDKEIYRLADLLVNSPDPKIYFRLQKQISALDDHAKKRLQIVKRRLEAKKGNSGIPDLGVPDNPDIVAIDKKAQTERATRDMMSEPDKSIPSHYRRHPQDRPHLPSYSGPG
jgi:hypothetical protein